MSLDSCSQGQSNDFIVTDVIGFVFSIKKLYCILAYEGNIVKEWLMLRIPRAVPVKVTPSSRCCVHGFSV